MPTRPCCNCGTVFHKKQTYFDKHANPCCSQTCQTDFRRKNRRPVEKRDLTPQTLHEILSYDPETGTLTWKPRPIRPYRELTDKGWNKRFDGKPAGRPGRHGHFYVNIDYKNYASHRIAWTMHYGEWPTQSIDHINGDPADNRICNLRLATQVQNMRNAKIRKDNTSGYKGVYFAEKGQKWCAFINFNGKPRYLGRFKTIQEAVDCRRREAERIFGDFAREDGI